jgi:hypothetical protein
MVIRRADTLAQAVWIHGTCVQAGTPRMRSTRHFVSLGGDPADLHCRAEKRGHDSNTLTVSQMQQLRLSSASSWRCQPVTEVSSSCAS